MLEVVVSVTIGFIAGVIVVGYRVWVQNRNM